jgi:hypothetical protein
LFKATPGPKLNAKEGSADGACYWKEANDLWTLALRMSVGGRCQVKPQGNYPRQIFPWLTTSERRLPSKHYIHWHQAQEGDGFPRSSTMWLVFCRRLFLNQKNIS